MTLNIETDCCKGLNIYTPNKISVVQGSQLYVMTTYTSKGS